jgi:biotin transport system substrate-specific component
MSTYADTLRPAARRTALAYDLALILSGSLLIALSAQIAVYLPFSPVPVTGQTLAVLLVGALMGSRRGSAAVLAYLAEGAAGMPVFANGHAGPAYMTGPTGGYLIGFVIAAYVTGGLAERGWDRRPLTTSLAMLIGNIAIYTCGLIGLIHFVGIGHVLDAGLIPFIPGDLVKLALATALLPSGWRFIGPLGGE